MTDAILLKNGFEELSYDEQIKIDGGFLQFLGGLILGAVVEKGTEMLTGKTASEWIGDAFVAIVDSFIIKAY